MSTTPLKIDIIGMLCFVLIFYQSLVKYGRTVVALICVVENPLVAVLEVPMLEFTFNTDPFDGRIF